MISQPAVACRWTSLSSLRIAQKFHAVPIAASIPITERKYMNAIIANLF